MKRVTKIGVGVLLAGFVAALAIMSVDLPAAFADPIGPDCGSCLGNTYLLQYSNLVVGATTSTLDLFLTIDTSGFDGFGAGNTGDLHDVAIKVVPNSSDIVGSPTLLSAPGGTGKWNTSVGGESAAGCGTGPAGFICSQANFSNETDADTGGTMAFEWRATVDNGTLLTGPFAASVKARFYPEDGTNEHGTPATSEGITLQPGPPSVPEPSTLLLLGSGLAGAGILFRRKKA